MVDIPARRMSALNVNRTIADMSGLFFRTGFLLPLFLLASCMLSSCGGSKPDNVGLYMKRMGLASTDLDRNINLLNPQIVIEPKENGAFYLGMNVSAGGEAGSTQMTALNNLQSVDFVIFDTEGKLLDSLHTDRITRSGLGGAESSSLSGSAGVTWRPLPPIPQKLRLVMFMRGSAGVWPKEVITSFNIPVYSEPIALNLTYKPSGKGLELVLAARRVAETSGEEYLPTSEAFRITLYNGPTMLWSTAKGQAFTQMIGRVEPDQVGEEVEYKALWNGTDSTGAPAKSGALTVVATIPAKPTPYTLRKEITWPVR